MKRSLLLATLLTALVVGALPSAAAVAEVDATYELNKGENTTHAGELPPGGVNPLYFEQASGVGGAESCTKDPDTYCEHILVKLTNPVANNDLTKLETAKRTLSVALTTQAADYDVIVYASDEAGTIGNELGRSTNFPAGDTSENVSTQVTTDENTPSKWVLVRVIYFAPLTQHSLALTF